MMVVVFVANKKFYKYMTICLYSLLSCTSDVKRVYLFTENDNPSEILYLNDIIDKYKNVEIIIKNAHRIINKNLNENSSNKNSYFTDFCMVKLMLSNELKEDKVLYIDTDAIVKDDISNVWKYDINNYYIAGVKDVGILKRGSNRVLEFADTYVNSGFVLFNLKKMREDSIQEKLFDILNNEELSFPDQDALNIVCHNKIFMLSSMYNYCDDVTIPLYNKNLIKVFHFAGKKDEFWVANRYGSEMWYEVEEKFYNEFGWNKKGNIIKINDALIDIIIPAFNANNTLSDTLDSIVKQTYSYKVKVYIIDDCSETTYDSLIDLYKYKLDITLLRLEKNRGPGYARQYGIDNSKSPYIVFIDSDDMFNSIYSLEKMYNSIENDHFDALSTSMFEDNFGDISDFYVGFDTLHAKIYKRSFLEEHNIRFPNNYNSEDIAFNFLVLLNTTNIGQISENTYIYKRRANSLTQTGDYYKDRHIMNYVENLKYVIKQAKENNYNKSFIANFMEDNFSYFFWYFYNTKKTDPTIKYIYDLLDDYYYYIDYLDKNINSFWLNFWINKRDNEFDYEEYKKFMNFCKREKNKIIEGTSK